METTLACEQCKFWMAWPKQPDPERVFGDCRRHAPQLFQQFDIRDNREKLTSKFPSTRNSDFCGSFKAKIRPEG